MNIILRLFKCWKDGHEWRYDSDTLGGIWIKCERCHTVDEYLPGAHEPKGGEAVYIAEMHRRYHRGARFK